VSESSEGVYVVARVGEPKSVCKACTLPFIDFSNRYDNLNIPLCRLGLNREYEQARWLQNEPVVYIGKTDGPIHQRVSKFYCHKCGDSGPHAGGQVVKLLRCDLWVYWLPANKPYDTEQTMLCAFKDKVGQEPFANWDRKRNGKRIRCLD
jgi:hypothetical protein